MKKLIIVLLMCLLMMPLFASNGDTLNIGGVVPLQLDLVVDPSAYSPDDLVLVAGATTSVTPTIADIDIATNNTAGWELWVMSSNNASLLNDDNDAVAYTLTYGGTGGTTSAPTTTGVKLGEAASDVDETGQLLIINYDQEPDYPAGYYTDQLTIILRAK